MGSYLWVTCMWPLFSRCPANSSSQLWGSRTRMRMYFTFLWLTALLCNMIFNYYEIILDLQRDSMCADSTESSHMLSTQFPLMLTSCISMVHLSKVMKLTVVQHYWLSYTVFVFGQFFHKYPFSVPVSNSGYHDTYLIIKSSLTCESF